MVWRSKLGKGMAVVGAGCLGAAGLLALTSEDAGRSEVSGGVVAAAEDSDSDSDDSQTDDSKRDDSDRSDSDRSDSDRSDSDRDDSDRDDSDRDDSDRDDSDRDSGGDSGDSEKRESSTTSTSAEKDRAETTTSTRRRSQASSSTSTSTSTTEQPRATSTTASTGPESRSAATSTTTSTGATTTTARPAASTSSSAPPAAASGPSTTTTTAPSSVPTALITEPASRRHGNPPVNAAQSVGPGTESRGPRLPTASTGPKVTATSPTTAGEGGPSRESTSTSAPSVTFEDVGPGGIGGADLSGAQLTQGAGAAPGEAAGEPEAAVAETQTEGSGSNGVLGMTGSATRTMLMMAGIILLLGALIVGFGESLTRVRGPLPGHTVAAAWGEAVPLAPTKREKARRRAGIPPNPG